MMNRKKLVRSVADVCVNVEIEKKKKNYTKTPIWRSFSIWMGSKNSISSLSYRMITDKISKSTVGI
jgi:hypothetical protein